MKKRMQVLLLALVLLWSVSIGAVTAQAAPAAAWRVEADGSDGVVTVRLFLENGQGVTNGRVALGYDAAALTLTEVRAADGMGLGSLNTQSAGEISLAWVGSDVAAEEALMLTAYFSGNGTDAVITAQTKEAWSGSEKTEIAADSQTVRMNPFVDVSGHWAEEDILKVYHAGLFKGVSQTLFAPDQEMNRAMFVTVLYRMAGEPEVDTSALAFTDVPAESFYTEAVVWAVEQGVTNGVSQTLFAPDKTLSRQELVTMLMRYAVLTGESVDNSVELENFADADAVASWAEEAMEWAVAEGIIIGTGENLSPKNNSNRAEAATILVRHAGL